MNESVDAAPAQAAPAGAAAIQRKKEQRVIWLLLGAAFVTMLNETVMGVAIPHLVTDLGVTLATAQWTTTAFMLTMAVIIPTTGWLLQRFTTRQVFIFAMSAFTIGTLIGAIAPSFTVLLIARVIQASGTALMMPMLMTIIMTVVPAQERGRFMGRISIVMAMAPALGPALSGFILNVASWHFLFWTILPVAIIMFVVGVRSLQNIGQKTDSPLDIISLPLSALGFGGILYGITTVGGGGSLNLVGLISLGAGALSLALFIWRQVTLQKSDRALLDLRAFASGPFALAVSLVIVMMAAMFGAIILLPIYLQNVLQVDSATTGFLLLPAGLIMGLLAPVVGRLFDKYGPRPLVIPGSIVASATLWALTRVDEHTSPIIAALGLAGVALGISFMMTPLLTSALGGLSPKLYSHGSAIIGTVQQLAGAIGTALLVTMLAVGTNRAAAAGANAIAAEGQGVSFAFLIGAVLSLVAVAGSFLVRNPATAKAAA
ncbi:MDR family MFS transporter [Leucobacter sp. UT-8R-CII-1-4]|uniref:MDR family MFS transporter n=1 Tax=Leucobacter sp. UT-8R-CII-1-4 TaxID=3040075 RepID=UPI0024A96065|nr:MDR family MFS transporter [Leucobacter sp. UT-8R-CII-1-4]MDI6023174.1 MDR family MFS transporter [Leucobacter sp. UT-8R-CII-1-4]